MTRPRSPETQVRCLRQLLRNARMALRAVEDPSASQALRTDLARDVIRSIDRELSPRRPRRTRRSRP